VKNILFGSKDKNLMNPTGANLSRGLALCISVLAAAVGGFAPIQVAAAIPVVPLYSSDPADGFNSTTVTNHPLYGPMQLGQLRRMVFQAGADYVGSLFDRSYAGEQIRVSVTMIALGADTLGTGGPADQRSGFGSTNPKYLNTVSYPAAIANHLAASNLVTGAHAQLQLSLTYSDWDYGINRPPADGSESFYTTTIHETLHGLGFLDGNDGTGDYNGDPGIYDAFMVQDAVQRTPLINMSPSQRQQALTNGNLYFAGTLTMAWNPLQPGQPAKLNAPSPYSPGSSGGHWDPDTWNPFGLMLLPSASPAAPEKLYLVAMERGLLYDIGFTPGRPNLSITKTNGTNFVTFPAIIGAHYALRYATVLTNGNSFSTWTVTGGTNQALTNTLTMVDVPAAGTSARFYSVGIVTDPVSAIRPASVGIPAKFLPKRPSR
jgi:hypothetical protein